MPLVSTNHRQGDLVHPELVTGDLEAVCAFYGPLLEWDYVPGVVGPHYVALRAGEHCAGLAHTITRAYGIPMGWCPYLAVDDLDAACRLIVDLGGTLAQPPSDVGEMGRIAFATDPTGAAFGMWRGGPAFGSHLVGEPGTLLMTELVTPDPTRSVEFYRAVFGYRLVRDGLEDPYLGRLRTNAEHLEVLVAAQTSTPPRDINRWLVYLGTENVDAAVAAALARGAAVVAEPTDGPVGRTAFVQDPDGAIFGLSTCSDES